MDLLGLEPKTYHLGGDCSNHLSHRAIIIKLFNCDTMNFGRIAWIYLTYNLLLWKLSIWLAVTAQSKWASFAHFARQLCAKMGCICPILDNRMLAFYCMCAWFTVNPQTFIHGGAAGCMGVYCKSSLCLQRREVFSCFLARKSRDCRAQKWSVPARFVYID